MLNAWQTTLAWFDLALQGHAPVWIIAMALALTTLLLEDLAIAAGVALATQGMISWELSLLAVGGGIALGDVGLYAAGLGARRIGWLRRRFIGQRTEWAREKLLVSLPSAILLARVIPGLRLVTYTACGFLRVPLLPFCLWVLLAVLAWTAGLYALGAALGSALAHAVGLPPPVAVALPILVLAAAVPLVRLARQRRKPATS